MDDNFNLPNFRYVSQDSLFVGLDGFGLMGNNGIKQQDRRDYLFALNADDMTPEGVAEAARHMQRTGLKGIAAEIARTLVEETPAEVLANILLPEAVFATDQFSHCRSVESVAHYGHSSIEVARNRIISTYCDKTGTSFDSLRLEHAHEIAEAAAAKVAGIAGHMGADEAALYGDMLPLLREAAGQTSRSKYGFVPSIPKLEILEPLNAKMEELLTQLVAHVEQNPEAFLDRAKEAWDNLLTPREPAAPPPKPERTRWQQFTDAIGVTSAPVIDEYVTPPFFAKEPLPEHDQIKEVVARTLASMPVDVQQLIYDSGGTVLTMATFDGSSHSHSDSGEVLLLITTNGVPNQTPQALDEKVIFEEFTHHVCGHKGLTFHLPHVSSQWRDAFTKDLGGVADVVPPAQEAARELLCEHTSVHTPSWQRYSRREGVHGRNRSYQDEVFFEILLAVHGGVERAELEEKLPNLMPLFDSARNEMREVARDLPAPPEPPAQVRVWEQRIAEGREFTKGRTGPGD